MLEVLWRTKYIQLRDVGDDLLLIVDSRSHITIPKSELTALAMEWLAQQGFEVTEKKAKLKPCPYCDSSNVDFNIVGYIKVECSNCGMRGPRNDFDGSDWNDLPREKGDTIE